MRKIINVVQKTGFVVAAFLLTLPLFAAAPATEPRPVDAAIPPRIDIARVPAPAFDDPIWHGASDPFVIWNPLKRQWWMFYTQRRAAFPNPKGVEWVHGSAIGIAASTDGSAWTYVGTAQGDHDLSDPVKANVTWWAPCFLRDGNTFHMYVVQVDGIYTKWAGKRHILHFTSDDLLHWKYLSTALLSSDRVIDPSVYRIGDTWYMVYKDEAHGSHTWLAHSADLDHWTVDKQVVGGAGHEAPFVWQWKGAWWLIVDGYGKGLRVYRSDNGIDGWTYNATLLADRTGRRPRDNTPGYHPDIVMQGQQCLLFYFTEFPNHYTYIQAAELKLDANGKVRCDRNQFAPPATQPNTATTPAK